MGSVIDLGTGTSPATSSSGGFFADKAWYFRMKGGGAPYQIDTCIFAPPHFTSSDPMATATGGQRKICRTSSGVLCVVWDTDGDILFTRSTDGGASWSGDVYLSRGVSGGSFPCITERNGSLYAAWQRANGGSWEIVYNYSSDAGLSWQALPLTHTSGISCPSPGPTPVVLAGTPGNSFELMIVYRQSTNLRWSRTTSSTPQPGSWTTGDVSSTSSTSRDPALVYQSNNYGYYFLAWANGACIYRQQFFGSSWGSPTLVNWSIGGSVYDNYYPSYALTQSLDHHIAWEGTRC